VRGRYECRSADSGGGVRRTHLVLDEYKTAGSQPEDILINSTRTSFRAGDVVLVKFKILSRRGANGRHKQP
jgi:hypothetical protein